MTRRNDRRLTTDLGEPVRNRESWTVVGVGDDGSLTVSSNGDTGRVDLPAEYAREHVRLGYAATEHSIQGDTTTVSVELVSALLVGLAIGWALDHFLKTKPLFLILFVLLGGVAGMFNVWRIVSPAPTPGRKS